MCFCCCWCHHLTTAELTVWRHDTLVFASLISKAVWRRNQVRVGVSARIVQCDAPQLVPVFCPRQCLIHVFPKSWMQTSTSHQCHPLVSAQRHPSIFTSKYLSFSHHLNSPTFNQSFSGLPFMLFFPLSPLTMLDFLYFSHSRISSPFSFHLMLFSSALALHIMYTGAISLPPVKHNTKISVSLATTFRPC